MKKSRHLREKVQVERPYLTDAIIGQVLANPVRTEKQSNGRICYWAYIDSLGKYVRVVAEPDGEIVTGYIDRDFERRKP